MNYRRVIEALQEFKRTIHRNNYLEQIRGLCTNIEDIDVLRKDIDCFDYTDHEL